MKYRDSLKLNMIPKIYFSLAVPFKYASLALHKTVRFANARQVSLPIPRETFVPPDLKICGMNLILGVINSISTPTRCLLLAIAAAKLPECEIEKWYWSLARYGLLVSAQGSKRSGNFRTVPEGDTGQLNVASVYRMGNITLSGTFYWRSFPFFNPPNRQSACVVNIMLIKQSHDYNLAITLHILNKKKNKAGHTWFCRIPEYSKRLIKERLRLNIYPRMSWK